MPLSEEAARIQAAVDCMAVRSLHRSKVDDDPQVYETAEGAASAGFRKSMENELHRSVNTERTPGMTVEVIVETVRTLDENFDLFAELFHAPRSMRRAARNPITFE